MKYLISTTEMYRVDNENEVEELIEEAKNSSSYELKKYSSEYKNTKSKGEITDEWYRVTLQKTFTSEKEPEYSTTISYS